MFEFITVRELYELYIKRPRRRKLHRHGDSHLLAGIYQVSFKKSLVLVGGAGVLYVRVDGPFRGVPGDW